MSVSQSIYLSICLVVYLAGRLDVCRYLNVKQTISVCLYECLSICLSACLPLLYVVCLFVCLFVCLSAYLFMCVCLSVWSVTKSTHVDFPLNIQNLNFLSSFYLSLNSCDDVIDILVYYVLISPWDKGDSQCTVHSLFASFFSSIFSCSYWRSSWGIISVNFNFNFTDISQWWQ